MKDDILAKAENGSEIRPINFTISQQTANTENSDIMRLVELEPRKRRNKLRKKNGNVRKLKHSSSYTFKAVHRFWNRNVLMMFLRVYITIFLIYIGLLSILWGSYYKRETRMYRMKYLAIIADDTEINGVQPYIGDTMKRIVNSKTVTDLGGWTIVNSGNFSDFLAQEHPSNTNQSKTVSSSVFLDELKFQVYEENYWAGCVVQPNATYRYLQEMTRKDSSRDTDNVDQLIYCVYQTGTDLLTVMSYVTVMLDLVKESLVELAPTEIVYKLINNDSDSDSMVLQSDLISLLSSKDSIQLVTGPFPVKYLDLAPATSTAFIGLVYTGLIYTLVISVQLFNFAGYFHSKLKSKLHLKTYYIYKWAASQVLYIFLSLTFALVTVAFQLSYDAAFGKAGFLVIWAAGFLNLSALGAFNECIMLNIIAYDRSGIGFYVVGFLVVNISVIISSITILPKFYRYGYALPLYNFQKILFIVFFNTTKKRIGVYFGIIVAWAVGLNILAPFSSRFADANAIRFEKLRATSNDVKKNKQIIEKDDPSHDTSEISENHVVIEDSEKHERHKKHDHQNTPKVGIEKSHMGNVKVDESK